MWAKQGDIAVEWGPNRVVFYDLIREQALDLSPDSDEDEEGCRDFATAHLSDPCVLADLAETYDGTVEQATPDALGRAREGVKDQMDYWVAVPGHEGMAASSVDLAAETALKLDRA